MGHSADEAKNYLTAENSEVNIQYVLRSKGKSYCTGALIAI